MSYVVLARRYRPQIFEDLIGQEHVTRTLQNAILQSRTAHAYLFTGPRGVGKTSAARILARALRCLSLEKNGDPCNKCEACEGALAGTSMDILEIDAASNTGVDNIRDLRENVEYMATVGKYRVYIIDEVHMLSTAAFNALLKTLEEPPPHVVFIFATTELHKVLPTILSRCQRFDFKKISAPVMTQKLREICEIEKVTIDDVSLKTIVTESEGCMRDSESLLDQAIALCGTTITHTKLETMLSLMDRGSLIKLAAAFGTHDTGAALKLVDQIFSKGIEAKTLLTKLVDFFSNLHFYTFTGEFRVEDTEINEAQKTLKAQWSIDEIVRALDLCIKTQGQLSTSLNASLTLESMIAKLCLQRPILQPSAQTAHAAAQSASSQSLPQSTQAYAPTTRPAAGAPSKPAPGVNAAPATTAPAAPSPATTQSTSPAPSTVAAAQSTAPAPSAVKVTNAVAQFEHFIKSTKPAWTPVLASIVSLIIEDETAKLVARADFAGKRLSSQDGIETLKLAFKLKKASVQLESAAASNEPKVDPKEALLQKHTMAKEHTAVKSALSIFNATIIDTKVLEDEVPKKGV